MLLSPSFIFANFPELKEFISTGIITPLNSIHFNYEDEVEFSLPS